MDISIIHSTAHLQSKTFKSLSFSCFLSKHCSIWDWFLNKYFGRSSVFQWNMLLFKGRSVFFFLNKLSLNFDQYSILSLQCWRVKCMAKEQFVTTDLLSELYTYSLIHEFWASRLVKIKFLLGYWPYLIIEDLIIMFLTNQNSPN